MKTEYDYIVVGSGAGGGPIAARLAEAGFEVLLLEAGGREGGPVSDVPAFHAFATEDEDLRWDFHVRHWDDYEQQRRDSKFVARRDGVWYPRTGSLGGCSVTDAMIAFCPHEAYWDMLARVTGDRSWRAWRMRYWFERLERCTYLPRPRWLPRHELLSAVLERLPLPSSLINRGRHGFDGWLSTSLADPERAVRDPRLVRLVLAAAEEALAADLGPGHEMPGGTADPNDQRTGSATREGLWRVPLSTVHGRRSGVRDLLGRVETLFADKLTVRTGCLVTRVLFDDPGAIARGVEFVDERHVYRADPRAPEDIWPPYTQEAEARGEVVLAAGAFNTPQVLMLSGIGPRQELERHRIDVRVDLPGVGANLQDHYEASVVFELSPDFTVLDGCTFAPPREGGRYDRCLADWTTGKGLYTTNGVLAAVTTRSRPDLPVPDLLLTGLPANFRGYHPGYAGEMERNGRHFTWTVLKAHTVNRAGRVGLEGADPRVPPWISFRYFEEGDDAGGEDLDAVVHGIRLARDIMQRAQGVTGKELLPGSALQSTDELRRFVRDEAWGHHACGTARMGAPGDPATVVDSRFRVLGTHRLRVADASVFPHLPGFSLATPTYMVAEKAAATIIDAAARYL
ncbi:GMC family oxidoreductase [Amycolatopsis pigmentata]|uniref:GMC family oxidoreductase n=1 Tax=Amycolatopsis pigmentata TaxID=450801 RepID=A0ABW5FZX9_9PSEU